MTTPSDAQPVEIAVSDGRIAADLTVGDRPRGLVIFAHGSGSSRHSPRNQAVARVFQAAGFATLLADLLTAEEEARDRLTSRLRFDIGLLGRRVVSLIDWARKTPRLQALPIGLFGASTGAAAALVAAASRPRDVAAVVSRGGRPDMAGASLAEVTAPTLLVVGSRDFEVIDLNRWARLRLRRCLVSLEVIPGASHLFEEPGTLDLVAGKASQWFLRHLGVERAGPTASTNGTALSSSPQLVLIVMAASTGGVEALSALLAALPPTLPAAIVIVQHRVPEADSLLGKILQRRTRLEVRDALEGDVPRAGIAYVSRADLHLTFTPERAFKYVDGTKIRHVRSSANPLFQTAAQAFGPNVIAVVLTGHGADATDGVQAVEAGGGIVIAQRPSEASGMPAAAIRSGAVDFVLPLGDIAPTLVRLAARRAS